MDGRERKGREGMKGDGMVHTTKEYKGRTNSSRPIGPYEAVRRRRRRRRREVEGGMEREIAGNGI